MSAFTVSPAHINAIVSAWCACGARVVIGHELDPNQRAHRQAFADVLAYVNADSVAHRYRENPVPVPVTVPASPSVPLHAVNVLKLLDCFDYQSSEAPAYEGSEVQRAIDAIRRGTIRRLPGYADAAWSL